MAEFSIVSWLFPFFTGYQKAICQMLNPFKNFEQGSVEVVVAGYPVSTFEMNIDEFKRNLMQAGRAYGTLRTGVVTSSIILELQASPTC